MRERELKRKSQYKEETDVLQMMLQAFFCSFNTFSVSQTDNSVEILSKAHHSETHMVELRGFQIENKEFCVITILESRSRFESAEKHTEKKRNDMQLEKIICC